MAGEVVEIRGEHTAAHFSKPVQFPAGFPTLILIPTYRYTSHSSSNELFLKTMLRGALIYRYNNKPITMSLIKCPFSKMILRALPTACSLSLQRFSIQWCCQVWLIPMMLMPLIHQWTYLARPFILVPHKVYNSVWLMMTFLFLVACIPPSSTMEATQ